ncbi:hypothetical protein [Actinomyces ruminicola]|uniref:Uncharacterized protein n=1 Tax=Actinomyces ruminicola TaxID=332524 RepID=A0A1G9SWD8_9ACTO|nr:hypothetical protein [Actinomyces ruminicola]SDM39713.1 hypothetical protein SAMN04487766_102120 [Actinomyces ruminicola]
MKLRSLADWKARKVRLALHNRRRKAAGKPYSEIRDGVIVRVHPDGRVVNPDGTDHAPGARHVPEPRIQDDPGIRRAQADADAEYADAARAYLRAVIKRDFPAVLATVEEVERVEAEPDTMTTELDALYAEAVSRASDPLGPGLCFTQEEREWLEAFTEFVYGSGVAPASRLWK